MHFTVNRGAAHHTDWKKSLQLLPSVEPCIEVVQLKKKKPVIIIILGVGGREGYKLRDLKASWHRTCSEPMQFVSLCWISRLLFIIIFLIELRRFLFVCFLMEVLFVFGVFTSIPSQLKCLLLFPVFWKSCCLFLLLQLTHILFLHAKR